jgi:ATP phosphoribosyltransferase
MKPSEDSLLANLEEFSALSAAASVTRIFAMRLPTTAGFVPNTVAWMAPVRARRPFIPHKIREIPGGTAKRTKHGLIPMSSRLKRPPLMPDSSRILKVAIPKGSLQEPTIELLAKAGYEVYVSSRGLRPSSNDPELDLFMIRAQEIGRYLGQGFIDCGITGYDWAYENEVDLIDLAELPYSRATTRPTRWVLVVPEDSPIRKPEDLEGKRIATEGVGITRRYLSERGINAEVEFSWGATEVKVPDLVDAIVDVTETGSSIKANRLRIVDTLLTSFPHFYANPAAAADPWKREKMDRIALLLKAALGARGKVGLKMNFPSARLPELLANLPSLRRPTISNLSEEGWVAVETVIDEIVVRDIIPELKRLGAEGIIEYPLNKIVP